MAEQDKFNSRILFLWPSNHVRRAQAITCTDLRSHVEILYPSPQYESKAIPLTEEVADLPLIAKFSSDWVSKQAKAEASQHEMTTQAVTEGEA